MDEDRVILGEHFRVGPQLGDGGQARIYQVFDLETNSTVAVKLVGGKTGDRRGASRARDVLNKPPIEQSNQAHCAVLRHFAQITDHHKRFGQGAGQSPSQLKKRKMMSRAAWEGPMRLLCHLVDPDPSPGAMQLLCYTQPRSAIAKLLQPATMM